jgi:hypothetical protein
LEFHLERLSLQWKDAAKHTDEVVALSFAISISTLQYFQIARTDDPSPEASTSWWRIYREHAGMESGSGLVIVVEINKEDCMNTLSVRNER